MSNLSAPSTITSARRTVRPVCTAVIDPVVLGEAGTRADAKALLRAWARGAGVSVSDIKLAQVRLSHPTGSETTAVEAWVPIAAWDGG